ncbi:MAG: hypothetical protein OHK0023_22300 [Anaerolineae bacterium]
MFLMALICTLWWVGPAFADGNDKVLSLSFTTDGAQVALGVEASIIVLDSQGAEVTRFDERLKTVGGFSALSWDQTGQQLAAARYDGVIRVWEANQSRIRVTLNGHIGAVNGVAWAADVVASAGDDLTVRLWELKTARPRQILTKHKDRVTAIAAAPDGAYIASGDADGIVLVWDVESGNSPSNPQAHKGAVRAICYAADGETFLTGSDDGTSQLWRKTGVPFRTFKADSAVLAVGFSTEGQVLTFTRRGTLTIYNAEQPESPVQVWSNLPEDARAAAFSPDGAYLALSDSNGSVLKYEVSSGKSLW